MMGSMLCEGCARWARWTALASKAGAAVPVYAARVTNRCSFLVVRQVLTEPAPQLPSANVPKGRTGLATAFRCGAAQTRSTGAPSRPHK